MSAIAGVVAVAAAEPETAGCEAAAAAAAGVDGDAPPLLGNGAGTEGSDPLEHVRDV